MRKWQPSIGGITKSTFSARKEMFLLMLYKNYMAENNVVGASVRPLASSLISGLGVTGPVRNVKKGKPD
jgi:hypothetical protein